MVTLSPVAANRLRVTFWCDSFGVEFTVPKRRAESGEMQARRVAEAKAAKKAAERKKNERFTRIKNLTELTQMQRAYLMDIPDEEARALCFNWRTENPADGESLCRISSSSRRS